MSESGRRQVKKVMTKKGRQLVEGKIGVTPSVYRPGDTNPSDATGRPGNNWKRELEKEMWTAGFGYSWRKMEVAAQDRGERRQVVCGLCSTGSDKAAEK